MDDQGRRRRAGGHSGNRTRAGAAAISQMPWRIPINPDRPTEPLDEDGVQAIHRGTMKILRDIGIEFLNPDAVKILRPMAPGDTQAIGRRAPRASRC